jgi:hypothetical protein
MSIKKILLLILFLSSVCFLTPKTSKAIDLPEALTSDNSIILKIQEGIEYFFTFKVENKVQVLEQHAEKRLTMAQKYVDQKDNKKIQNMFQSYLQIKEKQIDLLEKTENKKDVLEDVGERTIEQQKTMEELKTKLNEDGKQNVINIQEKVVNQVSQRIIEVNGPEGQTEFLNKVEHVWAPGTGPGGEAETTFAPGTTGTGNGGVIVEGGLIQFAPGTSGTGTGGTVYEGGAGNQFAPGTSAGGSAGSDIKNVEVKTGGGDSGGANTVENGNQNTTSGENADPGSDNTRTWIDP